MTNPEKKRQNVEILPEKSSGVKKSLFRSTQISTFDILVWSDFFVKKKFFYTAKTPDFALIW